MSDQSITAPTQTKTADEWSKDYERLIPNYHRYTKKLEILLEDVLTAKRIPFHLIESRTKELASFREKISRASKSYVNPISELTDLAGLRIITYYQDDADRIGQEIAAEFEVDDRNSVEHLPSGAEFGYRSTHYVVRISNARTSLPEWAGLTGLKAEIQVRTVLQHAWAAISHKLQYKREEDVPTQLRRKLFRLSALFELADDEFVSLRNASGTLSKAIDSQLANGERNLPIDHVSLSQFVEKSPLVAELCAMASEAGFVFESEDQTNYAADAVSDLIQLAAVTRITSIAQFEAMLVSCRRWAKDYLHVQYVENGSSPKHPWFITAAFVCELILIRVQIASLRPGYLQRLGWDRVIANRVFRVAQRFSIHGA